MSEVVLEVFCFGAWFKLLDSKNMEEPIRFPTQIEH